MFDGQGYVTQGVQAELTPVEISYIILNLREYAQQENGIDYLQVFEHTDGRVIWVIDQLNREMKESGEYEAGDNHFTLLLPNEY